MYNRTLRSFLSYEQLIVPMQEQTCEAAFFCQSSSHFFVYASWRKGKTPFCSPQDLGFFFLYNQV